MNVCLKRDIFEYGDLNNENIRVKLVSPQSVGKIIEKCDVLFMNYPKLLVINNRINC